MAEEQGLSAANRALWESLFSTGAPNFAVNAMSAGDLNHLLNAARSEGLPALVGEGVVLVPREPTPEMLAAAWAVVHRLWKPEVARGEKPGPAFKEAYAAMLSASPVQGVGDDNALPPTRTDRTGPTPAEGGE